MILRLKTIRLYVRPYGGGGVWGFERTPPLRRFVLTVILFKKSSQNSRLTVCARTPFSKPRGRIWILKISTYTPSLPYVLTKFISVHVWIQPIWTAWLSSNGGTSMIATALKTDSLVYWGSYSKRSTNGISPYYISKWHLNFTAGKPGQIQHMRRQPSLT